MLDHVLFFSRHLTRHVGIIGGYLILVDFYDYLLQIWIG